jgi:hypothetical protein
MTTDRDRVICVSLTEAEWQAFIARHPQPVDWLRQQILGQLQGTPAPAAGKDAARTSAA